MPNKENLKIKQMTNLKEMIDRTFMIFPETIVIVTENKEPIAIMYKEDWEAKEFAHLRDKFKEYDMPETVEHGDYFALGEICRFEVGGLRRE